MEREFHADPREIERGCQGELSPMAVRGLELFNAGNYFEAHEELELAWRAESAPVRELYRGILQAAVAYYHILRGNYRGAVKMFRRSKTWLEPFPDRCQSIDLAAFRQDYVRVEEELLRLGPDRLNLFNRRLMKAIYYQGKEGEA